MHEEDTDGLGAVVMTDLRANIEALQTEIDKLNQDLQ